MTPADIARAAADYDLHKRAGALCLAAEPHLEPDEDWPCTRHLAEAARQVAIPARHVSRSTERPRFDTDDEWDANGWERVPTWERGPGRI